MTETQYNVHKAAREGRLNDLIDLLKSGQYDVNQGNFENVRPLHEACLAGQYLCAKLLIDHGADPNLRNIDGATPLCDACSCGNTELVQLLLQSGAEVNPELLPTSPVHEAVFRDNWECLKLVLKHGGLTDKIDWHYGTPLHIAASRNFPKSAKVLLQAGADPNISKHHVTPLHEAARGQNITLVTLLLDYGADVYACNSRGQTARQLVPYPTSPCAEYLQQWESTPKTLKYHCRKTVQKCMGCSEKVLRNLKLPKSLTSFLLFD